MKIQFALAGSSFTTAVLAACIATAAAQSRDPLRPDDPAAAAPAINHESAFTGYQPFREELRKSWRQANREVADNPGMGSMQGMAGHSMPGMDAKSGAAGHDMGSMPGMPGMGSKAGASKAQAAGGHDMASMPGMPGMAPKAGSAPKAQASAGGHDMGSMQGMPGMAPKAGGAPKTQTAGAGHDMGSMQGVPGIAPKAGSAPKTQTAAAGHNMGSMQGMPGKGSKPGAAHTPHGADGHDQKMGSMQGMPGMASSSGAAPKAGHDMGSMPDMPGMASKSGNARTGPVTGAGVVRSVDKAAGKVRLTHDPIAAMGWPKMTLFFRLKESSLADRVKEGDRVDFSLEKSAAGYVISDLQKRAANRDTPQAK